MKILNKIKIYLNDIKIDFDSSKINYVFHDPEPVPKTVTNDTLVMVAGVVFKGTLDYTIIIDGDFDEQKLTCAFYDLQNFNTDAKFMMDIPVYDGANFDLFEGDFSSKEVYDIMFIE